MQVVDTVCSSNLRLSRNIVDHVLILTGLPGLHNGDFGLQYLRGMHIFLDRLLRVEH
jgi:pantothenate kinase-related protein Tda10